MTKTENESTYTIEILANYGGYRGLLINATGVVERRTAVHDTKELAYMALKGVIELFLRTYPNNVIQGVSKIDGAFVVSRAKVRGLDD